MARIIKGGISIGKGTDISKIFKANKKEKKGVVIEEEYTDQEIYDMMVKKTEKYFYDLNKAEQVEQLKKLGIKKIPRFEKGRVELLLELNR